MRISRWPHNHPARAEIGSPATGDHHHHHNLNHCYTSARFLVNLFSVDFKLALAITIIANVYLSSCLLQPVLAQQSAPHQRQHFNSQHTRHHQQQQHNPSISNNRNLINAATTDEQTVAFGSQPQIISQQNEKVVGAGSNVTLTCTAKGSPPLTFVWFQDEKNLTTNRPNSSEPPASTQLLEERRYEIEENFEPPIPGSSASDGNITTSSTLYLFNLKTTDTSLFLCWVENKAGYAVANFSIVVNDSPPLPYIKDDELSGPVWWNWGLSQAETQMGFVTIGFVIVLIAGIIFLLMFKHSNADSDSQMGNGSEFKGNHDNNNNSNNKKSNNKKKGLKSSQIQHPHANQNGARPIKSYNGQLSLNRSMLASDEDDEEENCTITDDGSSLSGSTSSCHKSSSNHLPKVMAASDLDNFIEHMRSGIINMDYHSMSPVIQFNNTLKKQHHEQQQQHHHHQQQQASFPNHHFASASGASSIPYSTTASSNLSQVGGNTQQSMVISELDALNIGGMQRLAPNCDQYTQQQQNQRVQMHNNHQLSTLIQQPMHIDMMAAPATNTTTTSYTSDYQSGYSGADDPASSGAINTGPGQAGNLLPPMYYEVAGGAGMRPVDSTGSLQRLHYQQAKLNQQQQQVMQPQAGTLIMQDMMPMATSQRPRKDPGYNQFL